MKDFARAAVYANAFEGTMSAASVFAEIPGVRACLVGDRSGRVFEEMGAGDDGPKLVAAAATLAAELERTGAYLGLGPLEVLTTKASSSDSWVIGCHADWSIAVQVDAGDPTDAVEIRLRGAQWFSMVEWDVSTSEIACLVLGDLPRDSPNASTPGSSAAVALEEGGSEALPGEGALRSDDHEDETYAHAWADEFPSDEAKTSPSSETLIPIDFASPLPEVAADTPVFAGDLKGFGLPDLVEFLANARRTGTLTCSSNGRRGQICMRAGSVVEAWCTHLKGIEDYLLAKGAVTRDALAALSTGGDGLSSGRHVVVMLLDQGIIGMSDARAALDEQLRDTLTELLTWTEGGFSFEPERSHDVSASERELEFDSRSLLLEIFRLQDEAAAGPLRRTRKSL
jgi:Domain of unknown function (DUF4388)